ncbi:amidohydrolase family protein [Luethyella okanaganae]|uniref:Amidohydrolase family protein n=1 Tax=Luethyella okanaganae TaxID=69372 RepID=A0ABW1VH02_9MICO
MSDGELDVLAGAGERVPAHLADALRGLGLIDHHVHGCFTEAIDRARFEDCLNEGSPEPMPGFMTQFDSQIGFAIRRWCAPLVGAPPLVDANGYWAARSALAPAELNARMLRAAGVEHWVIDTGFQGGTISGLDRMAEESGAPASEILRLETMAEELMRRDTAPGDFADAFRAALVEALPRIVGVKTICAYRCGFDIDWRRPADEEVVRAVAAWIARDGENPRLDDPLLAAFLVHAAAELGLPIQIHVGFGDRDLDLHRTNPMLLLGLLREPSIARSSIMLLHCYPYHREAGYLAQAFANVYYDIGLAINYVGARAPHVVAEALELGPFAKQLYSSDAFGVPEFHLLGSTLWRRSMGLVLGRWVADGDWSESDAIRVARMIGADNARRAYGLG